jgi:hypothetical protein
LFGGKKITDAGTVKLSGEPMNAALIPTPTCPATALDNPMGTDGFEFIEYAAPDPQAMG